MKDSVTKKIKQLRLAKGFSQEEIADQLNISRSAYERMENGKTNIWSNHIKELSVIFDIPLSSFFEK